MYLMCVSDCVCAPNSFPPLFSSVLFPDNWDLTWPTETILSRSFPVLTLHCPAVALDIQIQPHYVTPNSCSLPFEYRDGQLNVRLLHFLSLPKHSAGLMRACSGHFPSAPSSFSSSSSLQLHRPRILGAGTLRMLMSCRRIPERVEKGHYNIHEKSPYSSLSLALVTLAERMPKVATSCLSVLAGPGSEKRVSALLKAFEENRREKGMLLCSFKVLNSWCPNQLKSSRAICVKYASGLLGTFS